VLYQLAHPGNLLGIVVALVIGLLAHDAAQTLVAAGLGDDTARRAGRLTARAAQRLDPFGAVAAVITGWGWGSPVPVDERWRGRRYRMAAALAIGPLTFVVLALVAVLALRTAEPGDAFGFGFLRYLGVTFAALAIVSVLPLPPLDGGRIMLLLAPQTLGWQKARYQLVDRNVGVAAALAIVLLPRLFPGLPGIIEQLYPPLLNGLWSLVGGSGVLA